MICLEKKIDGKKMFNGKIFKVKVDRVLLENGNTATREVVEHNGGACVVALTKSGKIALVKQFRYCFNEALYELPAGKLNDNESPRVCAKRELLEEVGAVSEDFKDLGYIYPTPAYDTEKIHIFLAENISLGENHLDEDEFLDVEFVDFSVACKMALSNEIKDAKTVTGILLAESFLRK